MCLFFHFVFRFFFRCLKYFHVDFPKIVCTFRRNNLCMNISMTLWFQRYREKSLMLYFVFQVEKIAKESIIKCRWFDLVKSILNSGKLFFPNYLKSTHSRHNHPRIKKEREKKKKQPKKKFLLKQKTRQQWHKVCIWPKTHLQCTQAIHRAVVALHRIGKCEFNNVKWSDRIILTAFANL